MREIKGQKSSPVERRRAFVEDALAADRDMERSDLAFDAHNVHAYWRAKLVGNKPLKPKLKPWRA